MKETKRSVKIQHCTGECVSGNGAKNVIMAAKTYNAKSLKYDPDLVKYCK